MEQKPFRRWAYFSVLNLLVLSAVGILLRYKIILPLPWVHQKNLLHAHSHFAFSGWVSMAIFSGIVWVISRHSAISYKKYNQLFWLGQIASFGMLFTFPFMGYKWPSIVFSTMSVLFSYLFVFRAWKDISIASLPLQVSHWFKAALVFLVISSLGTFCLAYLMSTSHHIQEWYIGSVYFFLHFQYNGWFLFSIMGFFIYFIAEMPYQKGCYAHPLLFRIFFLSAFPAFFLSALWMKIPDWMYWMAVAAGLAQLAGLVLFVQMIRHCVFGVQHNVPVLVKWLWGFAGLAFVLKILMQALSAIPSISHFAFAYRPIVIGYLHLVLLGMVTFSILGFFVQQQLLQVTQPRAKRGMIFFIAGVVFNETLLMIQGIWSIRYETVPYISEGLFGMAIIMFLGLLQLVSGQKLTAKK